MKILILASVQFCSNRWLLSIVMMIIASNITFMSLQTFRHGGADCIQIGENVIEYNNDFKFYIATESR